MATMIKNKATKCLNSEHKFERIISIGDIHGCANSIKFHIDNINPTDKDFLIFLGDYVDRGPDSPGTIEFLIELKKHVPCFFIRGNHDSMLLSFFKLCGIYGNYFTHSANGGQTTLRQYGVSGLDINYAKKNSGIRSKLIREKLMRSNIPESHINFLLDTEMYLEMDNFFYSHAGFDTWKDSYDNQTEEDYVWTRENFLLYDHLHLLNKTVVHGHTITRPMHMPIWNEERKKVNLDSGCYESGTLSSLTVIPSNYSECYMSVSHFDKKLFANQTCDMKLQ